MIADGAVDAEATRELRGARDERRPRDPQRPRRRRHGGRAGRGRRRDRRTVGIAAVGDVARGGARDRRRRQGRRARLHRHPQPLRLHAPRRSAGGERRPPGRHARGRRELRLRLLPAAEQGARAEGDLRALGRCPAHLDDGRRLLRAARGGGAGDQRARASCRTGRSGSRSSGSPTGRPGPTSSRRCGTCSTRRSSRERGATRRASSTRPSAAPTRTSSSRCARSAAAATASTRRTRGGATRAPTRRSPRRCARPSARACGCRSPISFPRNGIESARRCIELVERRRRGRHGRRVRHAHAALRDDLPAHGAAAVGARGSVAAARDPRQQGAAARDARLREHPQRGRRLEPHRAARQRRLARPTRGATSRRSRPSAGRSRSTPSTTCCSAPPTTRAG